VPVRGCSSPNASSPSYAPLAPYSGRGGGGEGQYADFAPAVVSKETIKTLVESAPGLQAKHAELHQSLDAWWKSNVKRLEKLLETQYVFELRRQCIDGLSKALVPHNLLDVYQARGAVAAYIKSKYAVTTKQILEERDREAAQLNAFLTELGYNQ